MRNLNCLFCNKELTKPQLKNNNKYCSIKCFGLNEKGNKNPGWINVTKKCKICGKLLTKIQSANKGMFCSLKCRNGAHTKTKNKEIKYCLSCNKELTAKQKCSNNKFCSKKCYGKSIKDKNTGKNNPMYGRNHSEETKRKMRLIRIEKIKEKHGIIFPNYNLQACKWFKFFDIKNNTQGQYATNGGEFYIEELGYWPDYINFNMKLIIEWDEEYHKKQKEKDKIRQKQIMEQFPDFDFMRISTQWQI